MAPAPARPPVVLARNLTTPEDIANHPPLLEKIPFHARQEWIHLYRQVLARIQPDHDPATFLQDFVTLLAIPGNVAVSRGSGRRGIQRLKAQLRGAADAIANAPRDAVLQPPALQPRQLERNRSEAQIRAISAQRALGHLRNGNFAKAARTLGSEPPLDTSDPRVFEQLRAKHPVGPAPADLPPRPAGQPSRIIIAPNCPVLDRAVHKVNNGASPGPDGLTGAMLAVLWEDEVCRMGITRLVQAICNATIPEAAKPYLLASNLIALRNGASVRPIAVGSIFYRLAAVFILERNMEAILDKLSPIQQGVGVRNGVENVVHALKRLLIYGGKRRYALKLDFANAFNNAFRQRLLQLVRDHPELKELEPFLFGYYGVHSPLFTFDELGRRFTSLLSSQGVRQGDPLSSAIFALFADPHYRACLEAAPLAAVIAMAILDDLTLVAEDPVHLMACAVKLAEAERDGLKWQPAKTVLFVPHDAPLPAEVEEWAAANSIRVER